MSKNSNSRGRVVKKPPTYCTTESSQNERDAASNLPTSRASLVDRVALMMDDIARETSKPSDRSRSDSEDDNIIPSSQVASMNSLTFSDVMRVTRPNRNQSSTRASTPHERPVTVHPATRRTDINPTNPFVQEAASSYTSCDEIVKMVTENVSGLFEKFGKRQEARLQEMRVTLKEEYREDLKVLDEHVHQHLVQFQKAIKTIVTKERNQENLYPYEKPPGFPLDSLEKFLEFEEDAEQQQSLKQYLIHVGGITARDTLNQFLKEAMADSLTKNFSWTGKTVVGEIELRPLFNTRMGRVFYDALLGCRNIPQPPDRTAYARLMQEAIRTAKQRLRDASRRPRAGRSGRRQRYLAAMAEHYNMSDSDNINPNDLED